MLLVGLEVDNTAARRRAMPYKSATILHDTCCGGHGSRLTLDGGNLDVCHLAAYGVDERVELGVADHEPALLCPILGSHEVAWQ